MASPVKTLVVVGAGAGLGYSVAKRFGGEGFRVALISRSHDNVDALATRLAADIMDQTSLQTAIAAAKARFGTIDVLEYGPSPERNRLETVVGDLELTEQSLRDHDGV